MEGATVVEVEVLFGDVPGWTGFLYSYSSFGFSRYCYGDGYSDEYGHIDGSGDSPR